MASKNALDIIMRDYGSFRGLAARTILNYVITELEEIYEAGSDGVIDEVLKRALSLIEVEEEDLTRLKVLIERLLGK